MQYIIRQATVKDMDTLDFIHTDNMKEYVEKIYPWNPTMFRELFDASSYQIIEIERQIIGFIKVVYYDTKIYLGEIQIAKIYQNKGIGTSLILSVIEKARETNKNLSLKVLKSNPARKLYQRLGFEILTSNDTHYFMIKIIAN